MAQKTLTTSYLAQLTNANHDGVTQQIDDRLQGFETDNLMIIQATEAVHAARQTEDAAYRRYSGKDFASDDLTMAARLAAAVPALAARMMATTASDNPLSSHTPHERLSERNAQGAFSIGITTIRHKTLQNIPDIWQIWQLSVPLPSNRIKKR